MDTPELNDYLDNTLAVGDRVATAMVSRTAGHIRTGVIVSMGTASVKVKMDETGASVLRLSRAVVKVAS